MRSPIKEQLSCLVFQSHDCGSRYNLPGDPSHLKIRAAFHVPHCAWKEHPCLSLVQVETACQGILLQDGVHMRYLLQSPSAPSKVLVIYQSIKQDQGMVLS